MTCQHCLHLVPTFHHSSNKGKILNQESIRILCSKDDEDLRHLFGGNTLFQVPASHLLYILCMLTQHPTPKKDIRSVIHL